MINLITLFCIVSIDSIECYNNEVEYSKPITMSQYDYDNSDLIFCSVVNDKAVNCSFESLNHCHYIVDGYADCLMGDLELIK